MTVIDLQPLPYASVDWPGLWKCDARTVDEPGFLACHHSQVAVFISYSRQDRAYVDRLAAYLRAVGIVPWYDFEVVPGEQFIQAIQDKIEECDFTIVVMSDAARTSHYVGAELQHALDRKKPVLPLLLSGEPFFVLKTIQFEDVRGGLMPSSAAIARLGGQVVGGSPGPAGGHVGASAQRRAGVTRRAVLGVGIGSAIGGALAGAGTTWGLLPRTSAAPTGDVTPSPTSFVPIDPTKPFVLPAAVEPRAVRYSPDGTQLAAGSIDHSVVIWESTTGRPVQSLTGQPSTVRGVAWSPEGKRLASAGEDHSARIWDVASGETRQVLIGHTDYLDEVAWSPDGTRLATASADDTARIWDVSTGLTLRTLTDADGAYSVAWSPDGSLLAIARWNWIVRIHDGITGDLLRTLSGHMGGVQSAAWAPDGRQVATASADHSVRVWDAIAGNQVTKFDGHADSVTGVSWSPDGARLASSSADFTVRIWDAATGTPLRVLDGYPALVWEVVWSPDGSHVAAATLDGVHVTPV